MAICYGNICLSDHQSPKSYEFHCSVTHSPFFTLIKSYISMCVAPCDSYMIISVIIKLKQPFEYFIYLYPIRNDIIYRWFSPSPSLNHTCNTHYQWTLNTAVSYPLAL